MDSSNNSLCTHIMQTPAAPTHIMSPLSPPNVVRYVRTHTLSPPTIQESDSDWLNMVSRVTSVGDCTMVGRDFKRFLYYDGNGIKNTSIQINVQKDIVNVETFLF